MQTTEADKCKEEGNNFFKQKQYEQAIKAYSKGLHLLPLSAHGKRATFYANRAAAWLELGRHDQTVLDCTRCIELTRTTKKEKPDEVVLSMEHINIIVKSLYRRGYALYKLGNIAAAEEDQSDYEKTNKKHGVNYNPPTGSILKELMQKVFPIPYSRDGTSTSGTRLDINPKNTNFFVNGEWSRVAAKGNPPAPRHRPCCVSWKNQIIVYGGQSYRAEELYRDMFAFDTTTQTWSEIKYSTGPTSRSGCTMVLYNDKLFLYGASDEDPHEDLCCFDLTTKKWTNVKCKGKKPARRFEHSAVIYNDTMIIFGGESYGWFPSADTDASSGGGSELNDVHEFSFKTGKWSRIVTKGARPHPRRLHAAWVLGDAMYISGGIMSRNDEDEEFTFNDFWRLTLNGANKGCWTQLKERGNLPVGRSEACVATLGNKKAYIFAGHTTRIQADWPASPRGPLNYVHLGDCFEYSIPQRGSDNNNSSSNDDDDGIAEQEGDMDEFVENGFWRMVNSSNICPCNRTNAAMVAHSDGHLYVFGGYTEMLLGGDIIEFNDLHRLQITAATTPSAKASPLPTTRATTTTTTSTTAPTNPAATTAAAAGDSSKLPPPKPGKKYTCVGCGKVFERRLQRCARCLKAAYCSRECQLGDWKRHKRECKPKEAAAATTTTTPSTATATAPATDTTTTTNTTTAATNTSTPPPSTTKNETNKK